MRIGYVNTFPGVTRSKAQAVKLLEEASETFSAWEKWRDSPSKNAVRKIALEIADTVTACANLAAAYGIDDLRPYLAEVEISNRERGRYE